MFSLAKMPSTSAILSMYTSLTAATVLIRAVLSEFQSILNQILPGVIQERILSKLGFLFRKLTEQMCLVFDQYNGCTMNEIYEAFEIYLSTKLGPTADTLKISKAPGEKSFSFSLCNGERKTDTFEGVEFIWEFKVSENESISGERGEHKSFELKFDKKHREMVLNSYLPFVLERSKAIREENKIIKLYTLGGHHGEVNLDHPSTFETLAMDSELKKELIEDLDRFVRRRDYYRRVGKAWKRGYLLYGPPGTGKSSLIAAMANYLKFDIYDLNLATLPSCFELQYILPTTKNRSIIVIEDIDCSNQFHNRDLEAVHSFHDPRTVHSLHNPRSDQSQSKLSGLLNFIDGLWSSCGDERIIVFTTNYKDRLDPALLRPGRMDMHIHMSYCTPGGFRVLASNYHGLKDHIKFIEIEKLIKEVDVTPAQIAEELMKSEDADVALEGLIKFMQSKILAHDDEFTKTVV